VKITTAQFAEASTDTYGATFHIVGTDTYGRWIGETLNVRRGDVDVCCHTFGGHPDRPTLTWARDAFRRVTGNGPDSCDICAGRSDMYGMPL
jgi:hypothetical protein